jgi:Uma2 family endonuclease
MSAPAQIRYTYEDWLSIPEDSSRLYEIVDGELFVSPPPRFRHQQVAMNVSWVLSTLSREHGLGEVVQSPVGVRLDAATVTEPDVLFVATDRLDIIDREGAVLGAPDLVVEVLSPSNRDYDRTLKRKRYLASGVRELWIVDADESTVEVWRPDEPARTVSSGAVEWRVGEKAFEIPLAEIFRA